MTELLRRAIAEIEKLPDDQQDALTEGAPTAFATRLLAELKDEQAWETRFKATTEEQWDRLAAIVREDIAKGETIPIDEVFPT